jgi:maltose-binding protein MalE
MKTPVSSRTLKQHFTYNWWKYLLIAALAFGLVDLLYSVTAYRPPRDKTVSLYVYGYTSEDSLNAYLENIHAAEMADMEVVTSQTMLVDDTYGPMQLMTYLAAGEGDLYLLPREEFLSYATSGSLAELENDTELIDTFNAAGISLQSGWRRNTETGETHLYGIPQDKLPGLSRYAYAQDGYLCLVLSSPNQENAAKLLRILCRDLVTAPSGQ